MARGVVFMGTARKSSVISRAFHHSPARYSVYLLPSTGVIHLSTAASSGVSVALRRNFARRDHSVTSTMFSFVQIPHLRLRAKAQKHRFVRCALSSKRTRKFLSVSCTAPKSHFSRRTLISLVVTALAPVSTATPAQGPPRRTLLDEERELNDKMIKQAEENRIGALRAAFTAVEKASLQLEDLRQFADEQDWDGVRSFSRYFNSAVERDGMEPIARKLRDKKDREAALAVCKKVTDTLKQVDHAARLKDREGALAHVQETKDIVAEFQIFRP